MSPSRNTAFSFHSVCFFFVEAKNLNTSLISLSPPPSLVPSTVTRLMGFGHFSCHERETTLSETNLLVLLYPRARVTVSSPHLWLLLRVSIVVVSPHLVTVLYQSGFHIPTQIQSCGVQHFYCRFGVLTNTFRRLTVCLVDFTPFCQDALLFRILLCDSSFLLSIQRICTCVQLIFLV